MRTGGIPHRDEGGRAGEPEGPCPERLGPAGDSNVEQELAPVLAARRTPVAGRQWCPFTGLRSRSPRRLPGGAGSGQTLLSPARPRLPRAPGGLGSAGSRAQTGGARTPLAPRVVRGAPAGLQRGEGAGTWQRGARPRSGLAPQDGHPWEHGGRCWERGALSGRREQAPSPPVPASPGEGERAPTQHPCLLVT